MGLNDLMIAACALAPGGIMIVDDFGQSEPEHAVNEQALESYLDMTMHTFPPPYNKFTQGVSTAVLTFLQTFQPQNSIVPFLVTANKIYMTTATHAHDYRAMIERDSNFKHCQAGSPIIAGLSALRLDVTKRSLFNY